MMTHEGGRGAPTCLYPHLEFSEVVSEVAIRRREEGRILGTAQLSSPLAYDFGLDVHGLLFCGHSFACNTTDDA